MTGERLGMGIDELLPIYLNRFQGRTRTNQIENLRALDRWLRPRERTLLEATRQDIEEWIAHRLSRGRRAATVRTSLSVFRNFYRWCDEEGIITRDPMKFIKAPQAGRRSPGPWLDLVEMEMVLNGSRNPTLRAAIHLWLLSGLRPQEPFNIQVGDVLSQGGLHLIHLTNRKGGDSDVLSITPSTYTVLRIAAGKRASGPLMIDPDWGRVMTLSKARKLLHELVADLGIQKHVTPYTLRATYITQSLELGASERDVAASAGHATTSQIPRYDRQRRMVSINHNPTHLLAKAVLEAGGGQKTPVHDENLPTEL